MFANTSPNRPNRYQNYQQPNYPAGSRSPQNITPRGYTNDRAQTAGAPQRERSNSRNSQNAQNGGYFFQPFSTPYVGGKKNETYVNPNLVSSNVFYDHNYGYKGDLPNDRLLSPVRNDRHNRQGRDEPAHNNNNNEAPLTPPKRRADVSEDRFTRSQGIGPRRLETIDDQPSRKAQQRSVDARYPQDRDERRRGSAQVQNDQYRNGRNNAPKLEDQVQAVNPAGRTAGSVRGDKNDTYSIRDDRSEASTVVSTLSSDGYVCPKCLNRHMADGKMASCMASKREDQERERRIQDRNKQFFEDEQVKQRGEKARRVEDARNTANKLENQYNSRLEARRSPLRDNAGNLNNLFGRQDELKERQKAVSEMFRNSLRDQIRDRDEDREREKRTSSQIYNTSLNVGNPYYNKYLDDPDSVRNKLQEQIEDKNYKQQKEKEKDKRSALALHEQAMRNLEEEDRYRKEKQWNQRRELQDAYWQNSERKKAQEQEYQHNKDADRSRIDSDYSAYKRRQQEEEAKTKNKLFDFKQGLLNQMGQSSYKKMYEERRQQKEATSFDPKHRTKKKYPCGDCNTLYEKPYLTKLD